MKFVLILLLALGAYQCQAANVPVEPATAVAVPEPRDLDIFLATQELIKIVRNVIGAVHKGIDESKPSVDKLVAQLTPELGKAVKKTIDDILLLVKNEEERIEVMIKKVQELLDAVKKIKSCTDPVEKDIQKLISSLQDGVLVEIRNTLKNHSEPLNDLKVGTERILSQFRKLFDDEINNVIGCIKPGTKDAKKCITDEIEKIRKGVFSLATGLALLISEAQETLIAVAMELLGRSTPLLAKFLKDADPVLTKISECIAKMK